MSTSSTNRNPLREPQSKERPRLMEEKRPLTNPKFGSRLLKKKPRPRQSLADNENQA